MDNLLTYIQNGGTHQQNPNGGVPIGNGASAEEGETMTKDYVFSDRIKLTDKVLKKHYLPKRYKGKTIAEASKDINKMIEESNDAVDKETVTEMLERLKGANEELRPTTNLPSTAEHTANPDMQLPPKEMQGGGFILPIGGPLGSVGSASNAATTATSAGGASLGAIASTGLGVLGAAGTAYDFGNQLFGDTGIDTSGESMYDKDNTAMSAGVNAGKGALAGMAFGPVGAIAGGLIGGVTGLIGSGKRQDDIDEANFNHSLGINSKHRQSDFMYGGKKYQGGGKKDPTDPPLIDKLISLGLYTGKSFMDDISGAFNSTVDTSQNLWNKGLETEKNLNLIGADRFLPYFNTSNSTKSSSSAQTNNVPEHLKVPSSGVQNMYPQQYSLEQPPNVNATSSTRQTRQTNDIKNYTGEKVELDPRISRYENSFLPMTSLGQRPEGVSALYAEGFDENNNPFSGTEALTSSPQISNSITAKDTKRAERKVWWDENKSKIGNTTDTAMRFAPVATNLLQYMNMKKPAYESFDRLDKRYKPDYVDEASLVNQVKEQESTTRRALHNASAGDAGALRSNLLMNHLNSVKGRSQAFMQAENINRDENRTGQQFNQRSDIYNLQQSNLEKDVNARNQAAYDNNRSRFLSQIGQDIGNIGTENQRKKMAKRMGLDYNWLGEFLKAKK